MIILSNSIPKSGSTHVANIQEDVLNVILPSSGQNRLRSIHQGRYVAKPSFRVLYNLHQINSKHGSLVVKCHWSPGWVLDRFCRHTQTKMTMTYRDPRDMILSMIDHGERTRSGNDPSGAFSEYHNVYDLIPGTVKLFEQLHRWKSKDYVHCIKYEDLMHNKMATLKEMLAFLSWDMSDNDLNNIIESHEKTKTRSHNFNKGTTERWREEMNQAEKDACLKAFEKHLRALDYSLY